MDNSCQFLGLEGKFDRSVTMLSWAYNEEVIIGSFLERAVALMEANVEDWEIVVVDDGSRDRTPRILSDFAAREPRLRVVTHPNNRNVGWACRTALAHATKDYLFWETVDWSYDLKCLRIYLELLKHFDVVQGIRPTPIRPLSHIPLLRSIYRVQSRSDNFMAAIVSLTNYYLLRILYGLNFHDFQNITFYPRSLVQSLNLAGTSAFVNPEMLIKAHATGASFLEVPIRFIRRITGEAKGIKPEAVAQAVKDVFLNWLRWGITVRHQRAKTVTKPIRRVSEPFFLTDEVLALVLPLLKEYRP